MGCCSERMSRTLRISFLVALIFSVLFSITTHARNDIAAELRQAQKTLAAGDYDKAYPQYLHFAKEQNNPLAQFTVAMFHQLGWGQMQVDRTVACGWHEKAAAGAIPVSTHFLAECFEQGIGRPADLAKAAHWYKKAAQLGHHMSLCSLADLYMSGKGVEKDPKKGLGLCLQAVEKGAIPAEVKVGRYLLEGDDNIRDPQAAHAWFERAASKSPEAQYYLGIMHREGVGGEKTLGEALTWFESAASQGYVPAYFPTAEIYFNVSPDYKTQRPSAEVLAKAYMWLSATVKRSKDPKEIEKSQRMLEQVHSIMPDTWMPTLDERVAAHLAENADLP